MGQSPSSDADNCSSSQATGFRTKILYPFLIFFMRATCSFHLILLYLITLKNVW
jgi:hypothetical protein